MNIFVLDEDAAAAARYHCDKHVVKMVLESAQMLSTAHHLAGEQPAAPIYRLSYPSHPCTSWARTAQANYRWLHQLAVALCAQYRARYRKTHSAESMILGPLASMPARITAVERTLWPQCMPSLYHVEGDAVLAYRLYYVGVKMRFARWHMTERPYWLDETYAEFDRRELRYATD